MENFQRKPFLDAILFSIVLEVTLQQLKILELSFNIRVRQNSHNNGERLKRQKLQSDRNMIKEVVRNTIIELLHNGSWKSLCQASDSLEQRATNIVKSRTYHEQLKSSLAQVHEELKTNKSKFLKNLRDSSYQIAFLKDKIKDDTLNARMRLRYAEKWLAARQESLELQQAPKSEPPPNISQEHRVHKELLHAYELQIQNREESLEYWKKKYLDDTVEMDIKVAMKREEYRASVVRREELQQRYVLHEGEMRAWLTFKHERAMRLAREAKLRNSATCIQAWWRGVMVRKALGSFKYLKNAKKVPTKAKKK